MEKPLTYEALVDTDIVFEEASSQILVICLHAPTVSHAGGLRILDVLKKIRQKYPHSYIELFTSSDLKLYGSLGEAAQIVDTIVVPTHGDFSLQSYLKATPKKRFFDVVDFQFPQPLDLIKSYRNIGRKLIFTPMESHIRNEFLSRAVTSVKAEDLWSRAALEEAEICAAVDQTACVSDKDYEAVLSCTGANVISIETGVSDIEFSGDVTPVNPNDMAVCFVAYFGSQTNRDALEWYLGKVHPRICAAVPNYEFRIIGRGDIANILEQAGEDSNLSYIGEVPRIAPHLTAAAVGIAPALSGSGFRGKINQYANLGIPTVASPLAADGFAYTHDRSILVAEHPDDFADAIIRLLKDPDTRKAFGTEAERICQENYSWESKWPAIAELYDLPVRDDNLNMPSIHAVVPSYRHAGYIEQRIRSIFEQQYPNIRVTVIDDHSTDGSHEIIEALRKEFDFEYIRRAQNSGSPFTAWEYAAQNTSEDLIWICESDDYCDPMLTSKLVRAYTRRPGLVLAYCGSNIVDPDNKVIDSSDTYFSTAFHPTRWQNRFMVRGTHELSQYQRFGMVVPNMSSALIDTTAFRNAFSAKVKSFRLAGDWLFIGQLMRQGDVAFIPDRLNYFRLHEDTSRASTRMARRSAEYIAVRLSLSALVNASDYETMNAAKYDLTDLFHNQELARDAQAELRKLDPDSARTLERLIAEHIAGSEPSKPLARAMELGHLGSPR